MFISQYIFFILFKRLPVIKPKEIYRKFIQWWPFATEGQMHQWNNNKKTSKNKNSFFFHLFLSFMNGIQLHLLSISFKWMFIVQDEWIGRLKYFCLFFFLICFKVVSFTVPFQFEYKVKENSLIFWHFTFELFFFTHLISIFFFLKS